MHAAVAQQLIALNREFYQTHAEAFSATRGRLQPGTVRMLGNVFATARILDLGCGNGGVAAHLAASGHQGSYMGLDFSEGLLQAARQRLAEQPAYPAEFMQADLSAAWSTTIEGSFDVVLTMAVLHHLPSRELHLAFLRQVRGVMSAGGRFIHSNWQFMRSPKLAARVQPWSAAGLDKSQVEPGDYLLDWRSGVREGHALRYVHQFSEEELAGLAAEAGFNVAETFYSDGSTGDLSLYSVWELA
ncbi:MAG TPA: methyltransferase domain-containing protein [Anaerolineales bacterium]|nr:methyltransferase domain-containing protein [Anaerolineales bacterium]HRQ92693.1 methyltransferase domain-containing protein [Anaerolineales bacterium]